MNYINFIISLSLLQYLFFVFVVGRARKKYGVQAPAITGHELFERLYRVQTNTLELLIMFIPATYIAAQYWHSFWVALLGVIYFCGRIIYFRGYSVASEARSLGFILSLAPIILLIILSIVGAFRATL